MWQYENLNDELYHYGVKGMRWGVRKYQNSDGTLTRRGHRKVQKTIKKINRRQGLMDATQNVKAGNVGSKSAKAIGKATFRNALLAGPWLGAAVTTYQYKHAQKYIDQKIRYLADKGVTLSEASKTDKITRERFTEWS